jgi:hypothetical protein
MNRFEALHALGLDESATGEDVRLAYYGFEKAVKAEDFSDSERIDNLVQGSLQRAKDARDFLLNPHNRALGGMKTNRSASRGASVKVTRSEEQAARLKGSEQLRLVLVSYLSDQRFRRRNAILWLVLCIAVGFVVLRYLRATPRYVAFAVLGAAAIAGSTVLTTSHLQVRRSRAHVLQLDEKIERLKRALGLVPEDPEAAAGSGTDVGQDASAGSGGSAGSGLPADPGAPSGPDAPA